MTKLIYSSVQNEKKQSFTSRFLFRVNLDFIALSTRSFTSERLLEIFHILETRSKRLGLKTLVFLRNVNSVFMKNKLWGLFLGLFIRYLKCPKSF